MCTPVGLALDEGNTLIHLVLSLDYEIFGNGSGDVQQDMIEPTDRLLRLCDEYCAKVTIMFEVGEYWAMRKAEAEGLLRIGYSPTKAIEEQIKHAVRGGHDVQLHLHPWWVGATFEGNSWHLFPKYCRITDLPNGMGSEDDPFSIVGVLYQGKETLEKMIKPIYPKYVCLVYRAAMFWGQPSRELITGMKKAGLMADSSVINGLFESTPVLTDYRQANSAMAYWWTNSEDISQSGPEGEHIIEFPVYSRLQPYICNFRWTKLAVTLKRRYRERNNIRGHGMMEARRSTTSISQIIGKFSTRQPIKYDFCKLSANDMIRELRRMVQKDPKDDELNTPVVMLGHSKDFWNDRNLKAFLAFIQEKCRARVCFSTLGALTKKIAEKELCSK